MEKIAGGNFGTEGLHIAGQRLLITTKQRFRAGGLRAWTRPSTYRFPYTPLF